MYRIAVIKGDGIGPSVVEGTLSVLEAVCEAYGLTLEYVDAPAGDAVMVERGVPLPEDTVNTIAKSDACLKGPVGETAKDVIVFLRRKFDLYANLRPTKTYHGVSKWWKDVDLLIVRENTEDVYRGIEDVGRDYALSVMVFSRHGTERIAKLACKYAERRRRKITIVDKANVVTSHRLFRNVASEVIDRWGGIEKEYMYVDNAAYQLIINPNRFDVILTTNMFGDILSDEAAAIGGTLGIAPSANVGDSMGLFEPVHGSAPDIDPKYANPIATILSSAMMLSWLGEVKGDRRSSEAGSRIEEVVTKLLNDGRILTPDLGGKSTTAEVCEEVVRRLRVTGP